MNDLESARSDGYYATVVLKDTKYLNHFLGLISEFSEAEIYSVCKGQQFLYKESIMYPYINFNETKRDLALDKGDLADIHLIEHTAFSTCCVMFNNSNHSFLNLYRYCNISAQIISEECSLYKVFSLTLLFAAITFINFVVKTLSL